jgi:hypothetical protein
VCLKAYDSASEARISIGNYLCSYNRLPSPFFADLTHQVERLKRGIVLSPSFNIDWEFQ